MPSRRVWPVSRTKQNNKFNKSIRQKSPTQSRHTTKGKSTIRYTRARLHVDGHAYRILRRDRPRTFVAFARRNFSLLCRNFANKIHSFSIIKRISTVFRHRNYPYRSNRLTQFKNTFAHVFVLPPDSRKNPHTLVTLLRQYVRFLARFRKGKTLSQLLSSALPTLWSYN